MKHQSNKLCIVAADKAWYLLVCPTQGTTTDTRGETGRRDTQLNAGRRTGKTE